jgi:GT2 family glycosyltransferase
MTTPEAVEQGRVDPSDIAIIIPVGGAAPAWARCAESVARLDPPPGEIVAVMDGPNPRAADTAAGIGARVVVLDSPGGPARARNRGVLEAESDILLFIDSDVEVPVDLVTKVAELFNLDAGLTAVMGSYDAAPADPAFISQYRNLLHHFVHQQGREAASTFWAGCGAIRSEAFREVGGFDEEYPVPCIEDIELGSRLVRAGYAIRLVKDLQVKHLKQWRLMNMLTTDLMRRASPWTELMLREGRLVNDLNVKTNDRISVVVAFIAAISLAAAWLWPPLLVVCVAALVLIVTLNAGLFRFFVRQRGGMFALGALPLYWAYLLICGLGFSLGLARHLLDRKR